MKSNIITKFANEKVHLPMIAEYQQKLAAFDALIRGAGHICLAVHSHPDGDALGSGTALCRYLRDVRGKDCRMATPDAWPVILDFVCEGLGVLDASADISAAESLVAASDLVICLDMSGFSRAGCLEQALRDSGAKKVLIDHHLDPDTASFDLVFSETEISSASELLYRILLDMNGASSASFLPMGCLESLLTGMTTDTNNFANSVFPTTLTMASDLLACGVDRDAILLNIYNRYGENRVRAMGYFLHSKLKITPLGVAYIVVTAQDTRDYSLSEGDTEGFVNIPLTIGGVRLSLFLKEDAGGFFRVSIRSKKGTSAASLARKYFHGGGHECASGGRLFIPADIPSAADAESFIENATARFLQNG